MITTHCRLFNLQRLFPLDIINQSSKYPPRPDQPRLFPLLLLLVLISHLLFVLLGMLPAVLRRHRGRRFDANGRVPLTRRQDGDGVQELVDASQQMFALLGLVGHVVEHLVGHDGGHGATDFVEAGDVGTVGTLKRGS